jgi:hypothetical protein
VLVDLAVYLDDGAESLAEDGPFGAARRGAQRLAERVGYELTLETGTVAGRPAGTDLVAVVRGATTAFDLAAAFTASARTVLDRLVAEEAADAPDDERLVAIFLTRVTVSEGSADLAVTVVSAAGTTAGRTVSVRIPPED